MPSYSRHDGATLPGIVGVDRPDGARISDGRGGHLCYGPYVTLDPGRYVAGYYLRLLDHSADGTIDLDVLVPDQGVVAGKSVAARSLFRNVPTFVTMTFEALQRSERVEVRLYVHPGVLVEVSELVMFSCRTRNWGGI